MEPNSTQGLSDVDYWYATHIRAQDLPFYSLIAAALMKADTVNYATLSWMFPQVSRDLTMHEGRAAGRTIGEFTRMRDEDMLAPCGCKSECYQRAHPEQRMQRECQKRIVKRSDGTSYAIAPDAESHG